MFANFLSKIWVVYRSAQDSFVFILVLVLEGLVLVNIAGVLCSKLPVLSYTWQYLKPKMWCDLSINTLYIVNYGGFCKLMCSCRRRGRCLRVRCDSVTVARWLANYGDISSLGNIRCHATKIVISARNCNLHESSVKRRRRRNQAVQFDVTKGRKGIRIVI